MKRTIISIVCLACLSVVAALVFSPRYVSAASCHDVEFVFARGSGAERYGSDE